MTIKINYIESYSLIPVPRVGILEGEMKRWAIAHHLAQAINLAAIKGQRIFKVGSKMEFEED